MASEEERGQTKSLRTLGVEERHKSKIAEPKVLERAAEECDSHVGEGDNSETDPEYRGTREILWEAGGTTLQA